MPRWSVHNSQHVLLNHLATLRIQTVAPWVRINQAFHIQLPAQHVRNLSPRYKLSAYTRSERYYGWYVKRNNCQRMINSELGSFISNEDDRTKWKLKLTTETTYLRWISENFCVIIMYKARSQNCEKRWLASSCLDCPDGTARLPLVGFSWNFIFEYFSKICRKSVSFIKMVQE
jgi:hypothetical protein